MYTIVPYYITKTIVELPIQIVVPVVFEIVVYFGVGLNVTAG
jgi:hypothetical protein